MVQIIRIVQQLWYDRFTYMCKYLTLVSPSYTNNITARQRRAIRTTAILTKMFTFKYMKSQWQIYTAQKLLEADLTIPDLP